MHLEIYDEADEVDDLVRRGGGGGEGEPTPLTPYGHCSLRISRGGRITQLGRDGHEDSEKRVHERHDGVQSML